MASNEDVVELLQELVGWTRVALYPQVKGLLNDVLDDERKKAIYSAADGTRSGEQIRILVGTSPNTVTDLFKKWEQIGIVETLPNGMRRHRFPPSHFGVESDGSVGVEASKKRGRVERKR
jgi:hypothetical protein